MMYCEACGAANEPTAEQCFACQQPCIEENIEGAESAPSAKDRDNRDIAKDSRLAPEMLLQGRYRIVQEVGTGGFGSVYQATDTLIGNRMVAIKEIRLQGLKPNEVIDATDTFNREASILSDLSHPNLPRIYDSFTAPEHWYLVMDFISGETLETYLDKIGGRLLPDEVLEIGIQLCTVLDYLHTRQTPVIFRDLKPTNIMITAYKQVYLVDFGAARYFKPGRTRDTIAFGSPGYASPEQYGKAQTTARSDIYSLGATLHEALTGKDPGETPFKFSFTHEAGATIPADLEDLILRMVEMDASKRPASAKAVKEELQCISMQHLRRLYALPDPLTSSPSVRTPFAQGQPPPAAWATSAPSLQQAQMQLGLPPMPAAPKRNISRRAVTTMVLLGIAGAAIMENSRWIWSQPDEPSAPPQAAMQSYGLSQQGTFTGHFGTVTSLSWSDQMSLVASGSADGTVLIWMPFSNGSFTMHNIGQTGRQARVNGVAWSPGGTYVAATTSDQTHPVNIWGDSGLNDTSPIVYSGPALSSMNAVAWSPYNSMLATGADDHIVRVIEQDNPTLKHTMSYAGHTGPVLSLAWSTSGDHLASASTDKTVRVWAADKRGDTTIRTADYTFKGHADSVNAVVWTSLNGNDYVISGSSDKTVQVWDAFDGTILNTYQMSASVCALAWSPSNNIFAVGLEDGSMYLYRAFDSELLYFSQGDGKAIRTIAWSPDGANLVTGGDDWTVKIWRLDMMQRFHHRSHWHR